MDQSGDPPPNTPSPPTPFPPTAELDHRLSTLESAIATIGTQLARLSVNPPAPHAPSTLPSSVDPAFPRPQHPEIGVRNRRYSQVLAVSNYRLRDRTEALRPDLVSNLTSAANQLRPRLDGNLFCGTPPLSILPFLQQLTRVADQSHLSEAALLWIVEDFLRAPAKDAFRTQRHATWPEAVYWLLVTYAPESLLEAALRAIQTTNQLTSESVREFGLRLQLDSSALGSLLSTAEVKSLFAQGLRDPVRSLFAANQPLSELDDIVPLSVLIGRAELLETGTRAFASTPSRYTVRPTGVLALPGIYPESDQMVLSEDESLLLALEPGNSKAADSWVCYVCYRRGHGWMECPLLKDVSPSEKEEIVVRRKQYLEQRRNHIPARPTSPWSPAIVRRRPDAYNRPVSPAVPENDPAPPRQ
jgi:hypothetical protein